MQLDVTVGVVGDLEQRLEDVAQELLEVVHYLVRLEDVAEIQQSQFNKHNIMSQ